MQSAPRYNIYEVIHKALRARMAATLVAIGQVDADDEDSVQAVVADVRTTLAILHGHLHSENDFVHAAMEARAPGSTRRIAGEHVHHEADIAGLGEACDALLAATAADRGAAASRLYVRFDAFLHENLVHMRYEEDHHNAVLWASYTDEEIHAIERALVAAIPPEKKALLLHSMVPAVPTRDRVALLKGLRESVPQEVFAGMVASVLPLLDAGARQRLVTAFAEVPLAFAA